MARGLGCLIILALVAAALFYFGRDYVRSHPQDVPWTQLELSDPVGLFTSAKIAGLDDEPARCRALLTDAGTGDLAAPARSAPGGCGYEDGVRLESGEGTRSIAYLPAPLITSCLVAAALFVWESQVVQSAARRHFGTGVARIQHAGSYSCRRISGRDEGKLSEHATADALDVAGFQLADGRRVSVLQNWNAPGAEAEFLKEVRDGGCRIFSTVLSPDYNEAHRDHLHLDVANRGGGPWTFCR